MKTEYVVKEIVMEARQRVETLADLEQLANAKRCVICPSTHTHRPAAFMLNYPGGQLANIIRAGLYVYEPKPKAKPVNPRTTPKADKIPPPQYDPRSVSFNALERVRAELDWLENIALNKSRSALFETHLQDDGVLCAVKHIRWAIGEVKS